MNNTKLVSWVLRIAVAGEFIGHGVFAIQGKQAWIEWFAAFGVGDPEVAKQLLFLVGIVDIVLAVLVLIRPIPLALLWMAIWGFWTALIRPIVGEPIWDFIERSANWGAPLALLLIVGLPKSFKGWLKGGKS
ncbi:MAG TPA: DoxX family membrane protein [Candidatus Paceibacterota bacterium]|nr:DoxX family membrane protein [Candidatus Paceibacterota bacterium]